MPYGCAVCFSLFAFAIMLRFLSLFFLAQPYLNSITGVSIRYGFTSFLGPAFYFFSFLVFLMASMVRGSFYSLLIFVFAIILYFYHLIGDLSQFKDFDSYLKVVYPFLVFDAVRGVSFERHSWLNLMRKINVSIYTYCIFVLLSFFSGYQIQAGKGYFGLIYAGNDLIVLLILVFSLSFFLERTDVKLSRVLIFVSYLVTLSKSLVLLMPAYIFSEFTKIGFKKALIAFIFCVIGYFLLREAFSILVGRFFDDADVFEILDRYDLDFILRVVTFGRSDYAILAFNNGAFDYPGWLFGNGVLGAARFTFGKGGIEMDVLDSVNYYGVLGFAFLFLFYYFPVFFSSAGFKAKIFFCALIVYSCIGGHFFNNPLVGVYYGFYVGILFNDSFIKNMISKKVVL